MDDRALTGKCVMGDKRAWDEFVNRYSRLIYHYLHHVLRTYGATAQGAEDVNDLFQEFFVFLRDRDFQKLKSFQGKNGCSLAGWLKQVVVHFAIDRLRRRRSTLSLDAENEDGFSLADALPAGGDSARAQTFQAEELAALADCCRQLGDQERLFLQLHLEHKVRLEQLRSLLGISRSAVDMRKARIIERLRDCFRKKGHTLDLSREIVL